MNWRAAILPIMRLYWHVFKPRTYGVKVFILHPNDTSRVLLVRHTYGDRSLWNLPGGGFNPKKETALNAAVRETHEELHAVLINPHELCTYHTQSEGKRDTVSVIKGAVNKIQFTPSGEISEWRWTSMTDALSDTEGVAKVVRHAISHHCAQHKY